MVYSNKQVGEPATLDSKLYFLRGDEVISPFHDIPVWADKSKFIANMVVEIPRGTHAKLEINTKTFLNPIKQDVKDGKLRFIHDPYPFNYGAIAQTWENPELLSPDTNAKGDNDPLDVVDIGSRLGATGEVRQVKVLGVWAMIDAGETDWKILAIDVTDPLADQIHTANDLRLVAQDRVDAAFAFLRDYKIPDGKGPNKFAFDGKLLDRDFAVRVVEETHAEWRALLSNAQSPLSRANTTEGLPGFAPQAEIHAKLGW